MLSRALCIAARSSVCKNPWHTLYLARHFTAPTAPCCRNAAVPAFKTLRLPGGKGKSSSSWAENILNTRLRMFASSAEVRRHVAGLGIHGKLFQELSKRFVQVASNDRIPGLKKEALMKAFNPEEGVASIDRLLLSEFFRFAEPRLPKKLAENIQSLKQLSDLRYPSEWFPEARQMQRNIILHVGPTNSGKTYNALKRLSGAESGIYCGPLRLLAHEIYSRMNANGVACNLLTGEERREVSPDAPLTSSTIEMANFSTPMEVAVIDEIQMIADPLRGWAWTQALLGLKAKEIHLCGEASAVPLVKSICETLNEKVTVHEYQRLTPVTVLDQSLKNDWSMIRKGDCVVSFARNVIFDIKEKVEKKTGLRCAVVYGGLPPETRALQAKKFNDPNNDIDVLVASDAVGMGLNLNIKRIVFSTVKKFDGVVNRHISTPQLKQIGGRAGRFGTAYASGEITTMVPGDLGYVRESMAAPITELKSAGLQPTVDIFEMFALQMPDERFSSLLQKFEDFASLEGTYFLCNFKDQKLIADIIEHVKLGLRDRFHFTNAPVPVKNLAVVKAFKKMAELYSKMKPCELEPMAPLPAKPPTTHEGLRILESTHKTIMLYMWLSRRFPETFITSQDEAVEFKTRCESLIDETLKKNSANIKMAHRRTTTHSRPVYAKARQQDSKRVAQH